MDQKAKPAHLFLSYSTTDSEIAKQIYDSLWANNINLWKFDIRNLVGDAWSPEIDLAIRDSSGLIAIISPAYTKSEVCSREINSAIDLNLPVFPILAREVLINTLPDAWTKFTMLDLRHGLNPDSIRHLVLAIRGERIHAPIPKCRIYVRRQKQFGGSANHFDVRCDRQLKATLRNGEQCNFEIPPGVHYLWVSFDHYHPPAAPRDVYTSAKGSSQIFEGTFEAETERFFLTSYPTGRGFLRSLAESFLGDYDLAFMEVGRDRFL